MHHKMIILTVLLTSLSAFPDTSPKNVETFYQESENLLKQAEKKSAANKIKLLKDLQKSMQDTLDQYEKKDPELGSSEEDKISFLFYTIEPVFKLHQKKKITRTQCQQVQQEIKTGDRMGRTEDAPPSKPASVALAWLETICPLGALSAKDSLTK